jgi:hypothetical protein
MTSSFGGIVPDWSFTMVLWRMARFRQQQPGNGRT